MARADQSKTEQQDAGLCGNCKLARRVGSARQSSFYLCTKSASDPSYPKYPRLPMIHCPGYEPRPVNS